MGSGTFCFSFFLLAELGSGVLFLNICFKRVVLYIIWNTVPKTEVLLNVFLSVFLTFPPKKNNILN